MSDSSSSQAHAPVAAPRRSQTGLSPPGVSRATSSRTWPAPSVLVRSRPTPVPGAARIPDRHGDIGPGQTAPLRIDDFDLDDERTLIRGRFRGSGTGWILRDLSGHDRLASFRAWSACTRDYPGECGMPHHAPPMVSNPATTAASP